MRKKCTYKNTNTTQRQENGNKSDIREKIMSFDTCEIFAVKDNFQTSKPKTILHRQYAKLFAYN